MADSRTCVDGATLATLKDPATMYVPSKNIQLL